MPGYDYLTLAQARSAVARRLNDGSMIFWLAPEIDEIIRECIQTFNSAALYHRCRATFSTTPGEAFYDISPILTDGSALVLERTVTAQQLTTRIQYHLIENAGTTVDGSVWVGTECFTLADVQNAIYRRTSRFLEETGQILTHSSLPVTSGAGRVDVPSEWMDIRRAGWITPEGSHNVLWRTSEYVMDSQFADWNVSPGRPEVYSLAVSRLLQMQIAPPPDDLGTLDLVTVNALTTTGVLNIFNDFGWVVKWGALSDLLGQEGEAQDPERSAYAQQRYDEGVQLAKIMSTVLRTEINGLSVQPSALFDLDAGVPNWQDAVGSPSNNLATPETPAFAGPNLVALYPVPNLTLAVPTGEHSVLCDVVRNAIVPDVGDDGAFIEVGREYLDAVIYDQAEHIAAFKIGGAEWQGTMGLYKNLFNVAAAANSRLMENSQLFPILAQQEEIDRPRKATQVAA